MSAGLRTAGRIAAGAGLALCVLLAALMLLPPLLGYDRYVITSGSMQGTYDRGSLVYAQEVPVRELRVGDVITYSPPPATGVKGLVTHRIDRVGRDRLGQLSFRTKGDANDSADPWTFKLDRPVQARVNLGLPLVGYPFVFLGARDLRMLLIGAPALLIALSVLAGLWREAGHEKSRTGTPARPDASQGASA